ncbi:hypothetical protein LCAC16_150017 [Leuconostoc carnosum]|nr:hypothetical protein LCAC16_150017 [Leuconostoc carnosum]
MGHLFNDFRLLDWSTTVQEISDFYISTFAHWYGTRYFSLDWFIKSIASTYRVSI